MEPPTIAAWFPDWPQYAARIADAVRGLSPEQLALRASPSHSPVWTLAAHLAGARMYWLCVVCGEDGLATTPVLDPATLEGWDDQPDHPRSGEELGRALDASWGVTASCLGRWTPDQAAEVVDRTFRGVTVQHTRISILNRLLSHDAYHAGEIGQLLGTAGLPELDLWRRRPVGG
jgi:uncharacterized damage-inducible protein DinB